MIDDDFSYKLIDMILSKMNLNFNQRMIKDYISKRKNGINNPINDLEKDKQNLSTRINDLSTQLEKAKDLLTVKQNNQNNVIGRRKTYKNSFFHNDLKFNAMEHLNDKKNNSYTNKNSQNNTNSNNNKRNETLKKSKKIFWNQNITLSSTILKALMDKYNM